MFNMRYITMSTSVFAQSFAHPLEYFKDTFALIMVCFCIAKNLSVKKSRNEVLSDAKEYASHLRICIKAVNDGYQGERKSSLIALTKIFGRDATDEDIFTWFHSECEKHRFEPFVINSQKTIDENLYRKGMVKMLKRVQFQLWFNGFYSQIVEEQVSTRITNYENKRVRTVHSVPALREPQISEIVHPEVVAKLQSLVELSQKVDALVEANAKSETVLKANALEIVRSSARSPSPVRCPTPELKCFVSEVIKSAVKAAREPSPPPGRSLTREHLCSVIEVNKLAVEAAREPSPPPVRSLTREHLCSVNEEDKLAVAVKAARERSPEPRLHLPEVDGVEEEASDKNFKDTTHWADAPDIVPGAGSPMDLSYDSDSTASTTSIQTSIPTLPVFSDFVPTSASNFGFSFGSNPKEKRDVEPFTDYLDTDCVSFSRNANVSNQSSLVPISPQGQDSGKAAGSRNANGSNIVSSFSFLGPKGPNIVNAAGSRSGNNNIQKKNKRVSFCLPPVPSEITIGFVTVPPVELSIVPLPKAAPLQPLDDGDEAFMDDGTPVVLFNGIWVDKTTITEQKQLPPPQQPANDVNTNPRNDARTNAVKRHFSKELTAFDIILASKERELFRNISRPQGIETCSSAHLLFLNTFLHGCTGSNFGPTVLAC